MTIDQEIAEKIFNWKLHYPKMESGDHFSARGDDFKWGLIKAKYPNGMTEKEWHPSETMSQAVWVIDEMREKGYRMSMTEYSDGLYIKFAATGEKIDEINWQVSQASVVGEAHAVCLAALKAIQ